MTDLNALIDNYIELNSDAQLDEYEEYTLNNMRAHINELTNGKASEAIAKHREELNKS